MDIDSAVKQAVSVLKKGGVIAYPTEHCFGLGCDPRNQAAIERLLAIKQRQPDQGLILVAANIAQVNQYVEFSDSVQISASQKARIEESWPGPNTWILPAHPTVSRWVRGQHTGVAMRISAHFICQALCEQFGAAIVSTSANRHGQPAHLNADQVQLDMGSELDFIFEASVGGASKPSTIRDGLTGTLLR